MGVKFSDSVECNVPGAAVGILYTLSHQAPNDRWFLVRQTGCCEWKNKL